MKKVIKNAIKKNKNKRMARMRMGMKLKKLTK